jgi:fermentation-respiration switch protein FrsA (DUF1100 family)
MPSTTLTPEVWQINTAAGPVEAWFFPAPTAAATTPAPTIIFTHGNGEIIDDWADRLVPYSDLGLNLLLVEYPGYGRSAGKPSQAAIEGVLVQAYDRLLQQPAVAADRIILHGRSLGGGAACRLAANRPIAALILESTFTGLDAIARRYLAPPSLARDPFATAEFLPDFHGPLLLIHGLNDTTIPVAHAHQLAQAAPQAKLITYPCGHNDCPPDPDQYWADLTAFLRQHQLLN